MSISMPRDKQFSATELCEVFKQLQKQKPLVQCITNFVSMDIMANVLSAVGASPAMVHCGEEIEDFAKLSQALVINVGTLSRDWLSSMEWAATTAKCMAKPWVLDPVGVGATNFRTKAVMKLLQWGPTVVRGNASEILALANALDFGRDEGGPAPPSKGVDSTAAPLEALEAAAFLAKAQKTVVAVSGKDDYVVDAKGGKLQVVGGSALMPKITATGCSVTAIIAAVLPIAAQLGVSAAHAAAFALGIFKIAAESADAQGPGSLRVGLMDELYKLSLLPAADSKTLESLIRRSVIDNIHDGEPNKLKEQRHLVALRLAYLVRKLKVPPALVVNFDPIGLHVAPCFKVQKGKKEALLAGEGDGRQVTCVPMIAADGELGPMQGVLQGAEGLDQALQFLGQKNLQGCSLTATTDHWCNETSMKLFVSTVLIPWLHKRKEQLGLPVSHPAIVVMDRWSVHASSSFLGFLESEAPWLHHVFIPAGYTSMLQPCTLKIQKLLKLGFSDAYYNFAMSSLEQACEAEQEEDQSFDFRLSTTKVRPEIPSFLLAAWNKVAENPDSVKEAWKESGLLKAFDKDFQVEALDAQAQDQLFPAASPHQQDLEPEPSKGVDHAVHPVNQPHQAQAISRHGGPQGTLENRAPPRKRGRPRKINTEADKEVPQSTPNGSGEPVQRKRGRPKGSTKAKKVVPLQSTSKDSTEDEPMRRKRGRPKGSTKKSKVQLGSAGVG